MRTGAGAGEILREKLKLSNIQLHKTNHSTGTK